MPRATVAVEPILVRRDEAITMLGGSLPLFEWLEQREFIKRQIDLHRNVQYQVRGCAGALIEGWELAKATGAIEEFSNKTSK